VASPPGGGGGGLVTTGAGDGDGAVVGLGTGDGLGDGLGLGDGGVVGEGEGLGLGLGDGGVVGEGEGLGLGAGAQSMTVIELEAVPFRPSEDCHSTLTVTTSPFSAEIGNVKVRERPLQETECTSPSMLTVAECVPVLGKKSNVTLTSSQWILMATVWASDAVAAPRTRPTAIINTAAILVFGLMSPPLGSPNQQSPISGKRSRAFVPRLVGRTSIGQSAFVGLPRSVAEHGRRGSSQIKTGFAGGAPGGTRTPNLLIRSQTLCPN
jgi:hypothetical protein